MKSEHEKIYKKLEKLEVDQTYRFPVKDWKNKTHPSTLTNVYKRFFTKDFSFREKDGDYIVTRLK